MVASRTADSFRSTPAGAPTFDAPITAVRAGAAQASLPASEANAAEITLERVADPAAVHDEWARLAEQSGSIFATHDWISIWSRNFAAGRPSLLTACRGLDGKLIALLPLYLRAGAPARTVRFMGHGAGDELGPICHSSDRPLAARALRRVLHRNSSCWDLFLGERLPGPDDWAALLGGRALFRTPSPVLTTGGMSFEDFLAARSANFRQQVRRRELKLGRSHDVRYRLADDPLRLQDDLTILFELHTARWGGEGSKTLAGSRAAFHREWAARALRRGWLRLWFLEIDGAPVAAWYGFRFAGVESFYQAGRDPAWEDYSVGFVLMTHTIREALADGVREYRLLRGDDAYKGRFSNDDHGLQMVGVASGARGLATLAGAAAAGSLPSRGRALVTRLTG